MTGLRQVLDVVAHQLRRRLRSLLIWGVALGALGALYVALFPSMSGLLDDYVTNAPEYLQRFLGDIQGSITIEQWLGIELLNAIIPIALPFLAISIGARAIAGSEERKTLDLLLSNPLPRWHVVWGALVTMAASLAGVLAITWVITLIAVPIAGVDLSPVRLAQGLIALWPFCLLFGALALMVSAAARRAVFATVIPAAILVIMYVLESLGKAAEPMERARVFSLFYHLGTPVEGDFPWTMFLVTLAGLCALASAAAAAFSRRDIYT